jgi:hypothetical protein
MGLGFVFLVFLQRVVVGAGTVLALLVVISLCTRRRAAVVVSRSKKN